MPSLNTLTLATIAWLTLFWSLAMLNIDAAY